MYLVTFQDKNDVDVEKMKSTLILCYGYVALHAPEDKLLTRIDSDILQSISKNFNTKVKHMGKNCSDIILFVSCVKRIFVVWKYSGFICSVSENLLPIGFLNWKF